MFDHSAPMDGLIELLSLGLGFAAWWWVAKTVGAKGKGVIVRHLAGCAAWFFSTTVLFGLAQGVGLVDPPKPADANAEATEPTATTKQADATKAPDPAEKADVKAAKAPSELETKPANTTPGPITVALDVQVPEKEEGPHLIRGTTNLPDGTSLMVSINSKSAPGDSFQSKVTVQGGKFKAGPFGKGGQLPLGHYEVDVTMLIPTVQDASVQAVIGKKGENLTGNLGKRGDLGVTVERVVPFTLGGDKAPKAEDTIKKAEELLEKVKALEVATRSMKGSRQNEDWATCGKLMRQYQPQAEKLRDEARELPTTLGWSGVAAGHLVMCASCLKSAEEQCALARQSLTEAEKMLADAKK